MTQEIPPWVIHEAEKKRRKPGPRPGAKPKRPRVGGLKVRIELTGSVEFDLNGPDQEKLTKMLEQIQREEILDFLDPWASGIEVTQEVEVAEMLTQRSWRVSEAAEVVESATPAWMLKAPWEI